MLLLVGLSLFHLALSHTTMVCNKVADDGLSVEIYAATYHNMASGYSIGGILLTNSQGVQKRYDFDTSLPHNPSNGNYPPGCTSATCDCSRCPGGFSTTKNWQRATVFDVPDDTYLVTSTCTHAIECPWCSGLQFGISGSTPFGCITGCSDIIDGNYHSCNSCNVFASCSGEVFTDNRACPPHNPPLEYDLNEDACVYQGESETCPGFFQGSTSSSSAKVVLDPVDFGIETKNNYPNLYSYISVIGVILFILINNVIIGLWCLCKRKSNQKDGYFKGDLIDVSDDEQ